MRHYWISSPLLGKHHKLFGFPEVKAKNVQPNEPQVSNFGDQRDEMFGEIRV